MSFYNCCFSPTGGTKKVADALAEGWGETFIPVDLLNTEHRTEFEEDDLCIFSVPSYGGRIPTAAADHLQGMTGNHAKAILVAVFGNRAIDDTLIELSDVLKKSGFRCIAAIEAVAQHSLMPQYGAGRPDTEDLQQLKGFAKRIKAAVEKEVLSEELILPGKRPYKKYNGVPLKPYGTKECIGCGLCAQECPTGAIPVTNYRKTDKSKCISCMHCAAVCPKQARKLNKMLMLAAAQAMKKNCAERKSNKLYL